MMEYSIQNPHNTELGSTLPPFSNAWGLFLDVDGTLLDFALRPQDVALSAGLVDVLESLHRRIPLAFISGRRIADLDRLFAPLLLLAAGQHGAERRPLGGQTVCQPVSRIDLERARDILMRWAELHPGTIVEDKGLTLALHYRQAPALAAAAAEAVRNAARSLHSIYEIVAGNMVWEVRAAACNKGRAIEAFMEEAPFSGRIPVFIGDDVADEAGFALVNRRGGHSFKVARAQASRAFVLPRWAKCSNGCALMRRG